MSRLALVFALGWLLALPAVARPAAADEPSPRSITVVGEGRVSAPPDTGHIRLGVVSEATTAADAVARNSERMQRVMATLREAQLEERDIQTTRIDVSPQYAQPAPGRRRDEPPRIVGYRVANEVEVRVRDLDRLGSVLDAVVSAGANEIHGLSFAVAEPEPLLDQARRLAARNARARAETYAGAAGVRITRVLQLREFGGGAPRPPHAFEARMMTAAAAPPVARGEQEFRIAVSATYEIE